MRPWIFSIALLLAVGGVGAGLAQEKEPESENVTAPDWLRRPTAKDLNLVWPTEAMRKGLGGSATVSCGISAQGILINCTVVEETPEGAGFGAAAVALTPQFQMRPMTRDGKPVAGGTVRIPIRFVSRGGRMTPGLAMINAIPWRSAPSFDDVLDAYPKAARDKGVGGAVTLNCRYLSTGRLKDCKAGPGMATGYGFGPAAERLASKFQGPPLGEELARKGVATQINVVFAAETLTGSRLIGVPKWAGVPTVEDVQANYPAAAKAAGVNTARVVLKCRVVADGLLNDCTALSEEPAGLGFGASALALSPTFKVSVWTPEGLPSVGGDVRVPIRFDLGDAPVPPAPKP